MAKPDLIEILAFCTELARKAGSLIVEASEAIQSAPASESSVQEKQNAVDLVTEYDVRVEELLQKELRAKYPEFKLLSRAPSFIIREEVFLPLAFSIGEESYSAGNCAPLTSEPTFCVDPIDGTLNFLHGFPWVCVSIGLIHNKRPVLGVIYNPFLDHLYTGAKGHGSFLTKSNGVQLRLPLTSLPKPLPSLSQALVGIEWGSDRTAPSVIPKSTSFGRLAGDPADIPGAKMVHSLRAVGSSALAIALVAQGALDLFWDIGCWPWDVCAATVILQEAGGLLTGSHDVFGATKSESEAIFGDVTEEILTGRKYLAARAIAPAEGETASDAQKRIIEEFYETVEDVVIP
ncbi:Inositol-1-monophosphatase [Mycena kentingensis (nom. inval.)]|nr:Inositol-1-monophosphatase [Mycena kentingensis (nom. inval.)]